MLNLGHCLSSQTAASSSTFGQKRACVVYTHINTHSAIQTHMYLHTRRHRKKQLQNGVSDLFCPVVEMCLFLVWVGWDFLEDLGFGGFSKENQSFPKFPKVSQTFPRHLFVRVCASCPVGVCSEAPEGGFPKDTQSSPKKSQAGSPLLLARVRSHSPLS